MSRTGCFHSRYGMVADSRSGRPTSEAFITGRRTSMKGTETGWFDVEYPTDHRLVRDALVGMV